MAMANWTIDNASGVDDYAAFITSEGEVALYRVLTRQALLHGLL